LNYKLTKEDYIDLYPFFTPEEIKNEYGAHSLSPRQIRRVYSVHKMMPVGAALDDLIHRSYAIADLRFEESYYIAHVMECILKYREDKRISLWKRISTVEEVIDNVFTDS
jgi:hypothetical protein